MVPNILYCLNIIYEFVDMLSSVCL